LIPSSCRGFVNSKWRRRRRLASPAWLEPNTTPCCFPATPTQWDSRRSGLRAGCPVRERYLAAGRLNMRERQTLESGRDTNSSEPPLASSPSSPHSEARVSWLGLPRFNWSLTLLGLDRKSVV